jgi:hypothetical protein
MRDAYDPRDIIAHTLQASFPNQGDWENWKPLADLNLARLTEAGLRVVPVRLQDGRLAGHAVDQSRPAAT